MNPRRLKLTRDDRSKLIRGEIVRFTFPGDKPKPLPVGHVEVLSPLVKVEVTGYRKSAEGDHVLVYTLHNNRLGQRFLAQHGDELGYSHTGGSDVDSECGEAVDEFTQRRITAEARVQERKAQQEVILAVEDVKAAIRERAAQSEEFRKQAGRSLYRITAELDRVVKNAKRRAA